MADRRTLFIDGQVFQAEWNRGMGKYSLSLLRALSQSKSVGMAYEKVFIIQNTNLAEDRKALDIVKESWPQAQIIKLNFLGPSTGKTISDVQPTNQQRLTRYLKELAPPESTDYLILSLFLEDTCAVFPSHGRKLLLFYDLIPFLYHKKYEARGNFQNYLAHFKTIFEADLIFTISQTVANNLQIYLGIVKENIVSINGSSIDRSDLQAKKPQLNISKKFILMPSGDEIRKNNFRAVKAFEEFNSRHQNNYSLIITSTFTDDTKKRLSEFSSDVIFSGNVSDEELKWLYSHTELVFFASEHEGLGLPVLEGLSAGKRVACSDIPVFREISQEALFLFDHLDTTNMAQTIEDALTSIEWPHKKSLYEEILKKYTWQESAKKFKAGLDSILPRKRIEVPAKPKVAVFAPHPAGFSAIGKVVAESHYSFREYFDVDYFLDYGAFHRAVRPDYLSSVANCYDAAAFNASRYADYDAVIYHIGNSDYHLETIKNALYLPGYAVLHDTFLEGAFDSLQRAGYITHERKMLERKIDDALTPSLSRFLTTIVNNQLGIFTHSSYAQRAAKEVSVVPVASEKIDLPVSVPRSLGHKRADRLQISLAGIVADVKGLNVIEKIASSPYFEDCTINIFGFSFAKPDIVEQFQRWPNVRIYTNPSDFEFQTRLSNSDVLINYRMEYRGETSLTVLEAMRYGIPVIVKGDMGWYAELPDNVVVKAMSIGQVEEELKSLSESEDVRVKIGQAARSLAGEVFTHKKYAQKILHFVTQTPDSSNQTKAAVLKRHTKRNTIVRQLGY